MMWPTRKKASDALKTAADALTVPENIKDLRDAVSNIGEILKGTLNRIEQLEKENERYLSRDINRLLDETKYIKEKYNEIALRVQRIEDFLSQITAKKATIHQIEKNHN